MLYYGKILDISYNLGNGFIWVGVNRVEYIYPAVSSFLIFELEVVGGNELSEGFNYDGMHYTLAYPPYFHAYLLKYWQHQGYWKKKQ